MLSDVSVSEDMFELLVSAIKLATATLSYKASKGIH